MKTLILAILLIASNALAASTTITFSITSSAVASAPNLRIATMNAKNAMASVPLQARVWDATENYTFTKTKAVTFDTNDKKVLYVQTDQNTKAYLGTDLTNYILIYSGVPETIILR